MAAYPADTLLSEQDIKLRWLCSAVLLKRITPYQFAHLPLKQLPQISLAEFYEKEPSVIDNMYQPRFKEETLRKLMSLKWKKRAVIRCGIQLFFLVFYFMRLSKI